MKSQIGGVSISSIGTMLRLGRDAWLFVRWLRNKRSMPPPSSCRLDFLAAYTHRRLHQPVGMQWGVAVSAEMCRHKIPALFRAPALK